jgi:hypothetical protein
VFLTWNRERIHKQRAARGSKIITLEAVMRDLRFSGFLLVAILSSMAWAQTTEPSTPQQLPPPESKQAQDQIPATTAAAPEVQTDRVKRTERKRIDPFELGEDFREAMDRGIRLNPAGAGMCGSIVSYNFSTSAPGEVPHLESVTTCTPADNVVQRRAEDPRKKPSPPRFLKTSSPER